VDAVLGVIALAPPQPGQAGALKAQLMIGRIARRLALKEETVWARLEEIRARKRDGAVPATAPRAREEEPPPRSAKAPPQESQLLQVLLAEPGLVPAAQAALSADEITHPGLRKLLEGLYALHRAGEPPTLDQLRPRLDSAPLAMKALQLQEIGRDNPDRLWTLRQLLKHFQERRLRQDRQELHDQLMAARDHEKALELLRQLKHRHTDSNPGAAAADTGS
jgi:DNA primase